MKTVRAKFNLIAFVDVHGDMNVSGYIVHHNGDPDHENSKFNKATPGGNISIHISKDMPAQENFEVAVSKEYYLDITPAE